MIPVADVNESLGINRDTPRRPGQTGNKRSVHGLATHRVFANTVITIIRDKNVAMIIGSQSLGLYHSGNKKGAYLLPR